MLPSRRKKQKAPKPGRVNQAHRKWVRSHKCCVPGCEGFPIEFAHIRLADAEPEMRGGIGIKPSDDSGISLCRAHHAAQHTFGQRTFDIRNNIDSAALAREFAAKSPALRKMETGK